MCDQSVRSYSATRNESAALRKSNINSRSHSGKSDYEAASRLRYATIPELERAIPTEGSGLGAMLGERVTSDDIDRVMARATGIPVQSLL